MRNLLIAGFVLFIAACSSNTASDFTVVKVKEVEQVGSYTYLLVDGKGPEYWIAVPSMEAKPGEFYHYQGGMVMKEFYSKELDRTFDEVIFLEAIYAGKDPMVQEPQQYTPGSKTAIEKSGVHVETVEGSTTIAELYADPESFAGKTVRVRGEVTKFNPMIMDRNWIHLQDGTEHQEQFDLTVTSLSTFEVGQVVTLEGVLSINKDFGYGYSYEILLENAKAVD